MAPREFVMEPEVRRILWAARHWERWSISHQQELQPWPGGGTSEIYVLLSILRGPLSAEAASQPLIPGVQEPVLTEPGVRLQALMASQASSLTYFPGPSHLIRNADVWLNRRASWLPPYDEVEPLLIGDGHLCYLTLCQLSCWQNIVTTPSVEFMQALRLFVGFTATGLSAVAPTITSKPIQPTPIPRRRLY